MFQPTKKPRGGELTPPEHANNGRLSSIRMRIEHAMGGVTRDRIGNDTIRLLKEGMRDTSTDPYGGWHHVRLQSRAGSSALNRGEVRLPRKWGSNHTLPGNAPQHYQEDGHGPHHYMLPEAKSVRATSVSTRAKTSGSCVPCVARRSAPPKARPSTGSAPQADYLRQAEFGPPH
jgi:hypothetical protein